MERKLSIGRILNSIDKLFSEAILKSEVKEGDSLLDDYLIINGTEYSFRKLPRRSAESLSKIASHQLEIYLGMHRDNTVELFLNSEIKRIKSYQTYFPKWEIDSRQKTLYFDLEGYINYLLNEFSRKFIKVINNHPLQMSSGKKFFTDNDFYLLMDQLLQLDFILIQDFLDYNFSLSYKEGSMSEFNWCTMLRKHLIWRKAEPLTEDEKTKIGIAELWDRNKCTQLAQASMDRNVPKGFPTTEPKKLTDFFQLENKFWKGIPMEIAIKHFEVFVSKKSKNGAPFLTKIQLTYFVQRAFLKDEKQPKQKINYSVGEKGLVIKRFYEFFQLAVTNYAEVNRKEKYVNLVLDNFDNLGDYNSIEAFFKPNKTKENW